MTFVLILADTFLSVMKRIPALCIVFFAFSWSLRAQLISSASLKAGISSSSPKHTGDFYFVGEDALVAFSLEGCIGFFRSTYFESILSVGYGTKGYYYEIDPFVYGESSAPSDELKKYYAKYDVLSVAIEEKFKYPLQKWEPYLSVGPRVDIVTKLKGELITAFAEEYYSKTNFGLNTKIGVNYSLNAKLALDVSIGYQPDFTEFYKAPVTFFREGDEVRMRNSTFNALVGVAYSFSK